jgi:class 3 adenylate cyclase/tetratricopeptide (TPR) repeat protein
MERKLATVMFVDLVESSALVTVHDPEVVRRRVTGFFDNVSRCIHTHGGIVEKFAGDAVMAAFGIPRAHEDDAERAARAALGIMDSVRELGLEARIGVEAGEVVADDSDSTFATGEAVNIAARLQQTAAPGQILIGPGAYRLTLGRIATEDVGPLELKGRAAPLWAWHVLGAEDGAGRPSRFEAPLFGRDAELELLENTFSRAARDRRAHLFTIYGDPGVGKSRLAREFVGALDGATVLAGRCLPYGEGVTYWPLAEMVKASAGISDDDPADEAVEKLRACCEDEVVADLLALASGVLEAVRGERSQQEIAFAARAWSQQLAEAQPLVLVFEDIHWAEEPLLELIEHLAAWVRDAPLLLLCLARADLLDVRPDWGGGRVRAAAIELEALATFESEQLAEALLAHHDLGEDVRELLLEKTEGNPLFLEETVRMLAEENGNAAVAAERIPDTLQALIAARIDLLPAPQKALLQRASVIGRIFWPGAVAAMAPELGELDPLLDDLLLRELVLSEVRSTITGERAYRFKHVLIREVAYAGLAKSARAELHERFAGWLTERAGDELVEIRAYHLEQASGLHDELDGAVPPELAAEAARALEAASRRALARESYRTARKLALRAVELLPTLDLRYLAARAAWRLGDYPALAAEMEDIRVAAAEAGERRIHGKALTALAEVALYQRADADQARELVEQALEVLEDEPDPGAHFEALGVRAHIATWLGDLDEDLRYTEQALAVAMVAGRKDLETLAALGLAGTYMVRLEIDRAEGLIARARELAEESGSIVARARTFATEGWLHQLRGELDEAEAAQEQALELYTEIGFAQGRALVLKHLARLAWTKGGVARSERLLRESIRILKGLGERGYLCESQRLLAQLLAEQGRLDEAERFALEACETVGARDAASLVTTTMALGVVRAAQGRDDEAEELLRESLASVRRTSYRDVEIEPLEALAQFLRERGRADDAAPLEERLAELAPVAAAT